MSWIFFSAESAETVNFRTGIWNFEFGIWNFNLPRRFLYPGPKGWKPPEKFWLLALGYCRHCEGAFQRPRQSLLAWLLGVGHWLVAL